MLMIMFAYSVHTTDQWLTAVAERRGRPHALHGVKSFFRQR